MGYSMSLTSFANFRFYTTTELNIKRYKSDVYQIFVKIDTQRKFK